MARKERMKREDIEAQILLYLQNTSGDIQLSQMAAATGAHRATLSLPWWKNFIQQHAPDRKILSHGESTGKSARATVQRRAKETDEKLREFRDRDDLSLDETAKQAGLSKTTVIKHGIRRKGTEGWKERLRNRRGAKGYKQKKEHIEKRREGLRKAWARRKGEPKK